MNVTVESHSMPFWKLALRDPLTSGTLLLLVLACSIQAGAIGAVFWSRAHFGHEFDAEAYSQYQRVKSDEEVMVVFKMRDALRERDNATRFPSQQEVVQILERASDEFKQARARENEGRLILDEAEKKTVQSMERADDLWKRGGYEEALRQLQSAAEANPSYLPLVKALAGRYEERGQFDQARFQWEKIVAIASPDSPDAREAQVRIQQLALRPKEAVKPDQPAASVVAAPNAISLAGVVRTDLAADERYDLRFNLRMTLGSRGAEPIMDTTQAKVEVTFYDQSFSAAGTLVPLKVYAIVLQPKPVWTTGAQQTLSLVYSVPRGYFRKRGKVFGNNYGFCGYVVRVFYRQEMQDSYAEPRDPLDVFARRTALAVENKP